MRVKIGDKVYFKTDLKVYQVSEIIDGGVKIGATEGYFRLVLKTTWEKFHKDFYTADMRKQKLNKINAL